MNANKDSSNLLSVAFTQATVTTICSKHSGSILAQNEPQVQLSVHNTEKALEVFRANLTTSELTSEAVGGKLIARPARIYDLLLNCGLVSSSFDKDVVMEVIARLYQGPSEIDEKAFIKFLESFQAPAYNYGQRLRRNAGRGELRDVTDLIIRGCDVNTADGEGLTSLHYACEFNRADIVRALKMLVGEALMVNTKVSRRCFSFGCCNIPVVIAAFPPFSS
jgi:Ankyrin repeats (many copies)